MLEAESPQIGIHAFSLPTGEILRRNLCWCWLCKVFHGWVWPRQAPFLLCFGWPCWPRFSKMILQLLFFLCMQLFQFAILLTVENLPLVHETQPVQGLTGVAQPRKGNLFFYSQGLSQTATRETLCIAWFLAKKERDVGVLSGGVEGVVVCCFRCYVAVCALYLFCDGLPIVVAMCYHQVEHWPIHPVKERAASCCDPFWKSTSAWQVTSVLASHAPKRSNGCMTHWRHLWVPWHSALPCL